MAEFTEEMPSRRELVALYNSVGWSTYADDPDGLEAAVGRSAYVLCARDDGELVGLARVISDDHTIMYLQDILVRPDRQRSGIGQELARRCLSRFGHCRQKVLITDDQPGPHAFYRSLGFSDVSTVDGIHAFVRFDQTV